MASSVSFLREEKGRAFVVYEPPPSSEAIKFPCTHPTSTDATTTPQNTQTAATTQPSSTHSPTTSHGATALTRPPRSNLCPGWTRTYSLRDHLRVKEQLKHAICPADRVLDSFPNPHDPLTLAFALDVSCLKSLDTAGMKTFFFICPLTPKIDPGRYWRSSTPRTTYNFGRVTTGVLVRGLAWVRCISLH
jgi:hypothetical protein